jgi:hypothetical protein
MRYKSNTEKVLVGITPYHNHKTVKAVEEVEEALTMLKDMVGITRHRKYNKKGELVESNEEVLYGNWAIVSPTLIKKIESVGYSCVQRG